MITKILLCGLLVFLCGLRPASGASADTTGEVEYRFALGVQLGTDIGGALPFPFRHIPETFNPYPKLSPSLGLKFTFPIDTRWTLGAEMTYKRVALDADARVENQRFKKVSATPGQTIIASFTGSAEMGMEFTMLEFPLYVKYTFANGKDRVLAGGYATWNMNGKFDVFAKKGYTLNDEGVFDAPVNEEDQFNMDFSESMDNWDAGIVLGYERLLFPRVEIGLRFMCGFKDIFKADNQYFDYKMIHMRGCLALSYNLFNIRPSKLNPFPRRDR